MRFYPHAARTENAISRPLPSSNRLVSPDLGKKSGDSGTTPSTLPGAIPVALLTGGSDKPYVFGLATSLLADGATVDLIGSDELDCPEFRNQSSLTFLNIRGSQSEDASVRTKVVRILSYYAKLVRYAAAAEPTIFHILWNNRFEVFDRTVLTLYYKLLGKRVVLTAHNVNARRRDAEDNWLNRLTLKIQYLLADHLFVHTDAMKSELRKQFGVAEGRISVIPFGINNAVPDTLLTASQAKQRLGLAKGEKAILFFGRITPYKGLEYLVAAFRHLLAEDGSYRLIIAGRPDRCEPYWRAIREGIRDLEADNKVVLRPHFIPDEETEVFFKAADVVVLPYKDIYQSGVLFLAQSFGLPVIAADIGAFRDDIVEGKTGFVFKPEDPIDLARVIRAHFSSDLYALLEFVRLEIRDRAVQSHSWNTVSQKTMGVYAELLSGPGSKICLQHRKY